MDICPCVWFFVPLLLSVLIHLQAYALLTHSTSTKVRLFFQRKPMWKFLDLLGHERMFLLLCNETYRPMSAAHPLLITTLRIWLSSFAEEKICLISQQLCHFAKRYSI